MYFKNSEGYDDYTAQIAIARADKQLKKARKRKMQYLESNEQQALFRWAAYSEGKWPELRWLFAIPNGGKRDAREAARLKAEGVRAGVSDICLPVPNGNYHGLFVELKAGAGKPSDHQKAFLNFVNWHGYYGVVCNGWEEARKTIETYLSTASQDKAGG